MQPVAKAGQRARSFQFSLLTDRAPDDVLNDFAGRSLPGIAVAEKGRNYLILRPRRRHRYGADIAAGLAIGITLIVLMLTAITPVLIVLLPIAATPALPLLLDHRPDLAISAVVDDDIRATRVTVHGLASPELAAALDAYLGSLPRWSRPAPAARQPVTSGAG